MLNFMPSLFLSHGAPTLALEQTPTSDFLRQLTTMIPKPKAIILASAHWETDMPMLTATAHPETIHDFHGFPKALYDLQYKVPGDPVLAGRIQQILQDAGFPAVLDKKRGLDHGAWNPLLLAYPDANIPVIQLSVQPDKDARWHYCIGQALSALCKENILIIGSGNLTHNLREAFRGNHAQTPLWVTAFSDWVAGCVTKGDTDSLLDWVHLAPYARENHPTPEHFLPFFVALGAGGAPLNARRLHEDTAFGVLAMDAYMFGGNR